MANAAISNVTDDSSNNLPILDPSFAKSIAQAELAEQQRKEDIAKLLALAAQLQHADPMLAAMLIMTTFMDVQGDTMGGLAAVQDLDSAMRNAISKGQDALNAQSSGGITYEMKDFIDSVNGLENFLKYEQSLGNNAQIDPDTTKQMLGALDSIKAQFGTDWGQTSNMTNDWGNWISSAKNLGTPSAQISAIQSSLQTLTQSTSALSTVSSTDMQFYTQQFQQILNVANNIMRTDQQGKQAYVNAQKSN